jgi:cell filamentation protein
VASLALFVFEDEPLRRPTDEARFKATHRAIFGDVYEWAGSYRENTGKMTKGRDAGHVVTYGDSAFVLGEISRIFAELQRENYLEELAPDSFAEKLAYFYSEIDATHPFREGNSRTLRQVAADLALVAGYELDWEPTGRTEQSKNELYVARDHAAFHRQYEQLTAIIRTNLHPLTS